MHLSVGEKVVRAFPLVKYFKGKQVMRECGGHGDYHSTQKTSANHICALGEISQDTRLDCQPHPAWWLQDGILFTVVLAFTIKSRKQHHHSITC